MSTTLKHGAFIETATWPIVARSTEFRPRKPENRRSFRFSCSSIGSMGTSVEIASPFNLCLSDGHWRGRANVRTLGHDKALFRSSFLESFAKNFIVRVSLWVITEFHWVLARVVLEDPVLLLKWTCCLSRTQCMNPLGLNKKVSIRMI